MVGEDPYVLHNQSGFLKNPSVEALQNKLIFRQSVQGYQEGVINISTPIGLDVEYLARRLKSIG